MRLSRSHSSGVGDRRPGRSRVPATVLATLLVIAAEFALLTAVYHLGDTNRGQQQIAAELAGSLTGAPASTGGNEATLALVERLHTAGVSTRQLAPLRQAVSEGHPAAARTAVGVLRDRLAGHGRALDRAAEAFYVVLLLAASVGWMIWFRKLVARHRGLQREMTEQQTMVTGELRLAALVRNSADVVAVCDATGAISYLTPSAETVLGHPAAGLLNRPYAELVHPDDISLFQQLLETRRGADEARVQVRLRHADGRFLNVEGTVNNLLDNPVVGGLVITVRDITARVQLEERLTHQAFHDSLTGLANRQLFTDRLTHALERRGTHGQELVVLFCDLDDFKNVNDSRGHGIGDQVLAEIGLRVRSVIRSGDTAARLGGDEFAILMEGSDLEAAQLVAQRLQAAVAEPMILDGTRFSLGASVGLASAAPGGISAEDALRNADVAMYLAKSRGKNVVALYESQLHTAALERLELRAELKRALRNDELVLHYQPTVDLQRGGIVGFEALVRWQHPTRGFLPPGVFIPVAEESGLIVALGSWVLTTACAAAAAMQSAGSRPTMSVNVAAEQLTLPNFVDEVMAALATSGLAPDRLCLEITESVVLHDLDAIAPRLTALRERGIRIAIDDFGTGYSSLAYLSHLPVDVLKVDKSFVDRITVDRQDASLTEAILAMSRSMNLSTVAEGVEDSAQAAWLTGANCSYGQGYLWSRPVSLEHARALLTSSIGATELAVQLPAAG